jgi:hypothetical protein
VTRSATRAEPAGRIGELGEALPRLRTVIGLVALSNAGSVADHEQLCRQFTSWIDAGNRPLRR